MRLGYDCCGNVSVGMKLFFGGSTVTGKASEHEQACMSNNLCCVHV